MKKIHFMLIFILIFSACGGNSELKNIQEPDSSINNGSVNEEIPKIDDSPDQNRPSSEIFEPEEPVVQEPEILEKTYHMNQNYFIVPDDPEGDKKVVLLTFDDGPKDEVMITEIINILNKFQAKAIFFVNGFRVERNPELLLQIHDAGQIIGNHSWDHINLREQTNEKIDQQIMDLQNKVIELTGEAPKFFRPPFGASNDYVKEKVAAEQMLFMTWSNGSLDWDVRFQNKPEEIINNVMDQLLPGSNILMHELPWTILALDELLNKIIEEGYTFIDPRAIHLEIGNPTKAN